MIKENLVLVFGGSGFIGTNLIELLLESGNNVVNADIASPINDYHTAVYQYCDLMDYDAVLLLLTQVKPDFVINLAARTDLLGSKDDDYLVNTHGVENLCRALAISNMVKRVIFASSMLVCKVGHVPLTVNDYSADTAYGKSKIQGEKIVKKWSSKMPPSVIVRPTSIWGPWFREPYRDFFIRVMDGGYYNIRGVSAKKTYGFVGNAVQELVVLLYNDKKSLNNLIYIGDYPAMSARTWSLLIRSEQKESTPLELPYFIFWLAAKVGDFLKVIGIRFPMTSFRFANMCANYDLSHIVSKETDPKQLISVKEGVARTIAWLQREI
jgi:nucleoside-diphosphate-sugar epimerase